MMLRGNIRDLLTPSIKNLQHERKESFGNKVMLVCSANGMERRSKHFVEHLLMQQGFFIMNLPLEKYATPNLRGAEPQWETVHRGLQMIHRVKGCDAIISLGGPACMDVSKTISYLSACNMTSITHASVLHEVSYALSIDQVDSIRTPPTTSMNHNHNHNKLYMNDKNSSSSIMSFVGSKIPTLNIPLVSCMGASNSTTSDIVDWSETKTHFKFFDPYMMKSEAQIIDLDLIREDSVPLPVNMMMWTGTLSRWVDCILMNPSPKIQVNEYATRIQVQSIAKGLEAVLEKSGNLSPQEVSKINHQALELSLFCGSAWSDIVGKLLKNEIPMSWHANLCENISSHLPFGYSAISMALWPWTLRMNLLDPRFLNEGKRNRWDFISKELTQEENAKDWDSVKWVDRIIGPSSFPTNKNLLMNISESDRESQRQIIFSAIKSSSFPTIMKDEQQQPYDNNTLPIGEIESNIRAILKVLV